MSKQHENELKVITKGKELVKNIYKICSLLPKEETFILCSQIQRASISIPSNLAEGKQRTDKEFLRFIRIARGSLSETKIQLDIISDIYPSIYRNNINLILNTYDIIEEIGKMSYGLMLKLKAEG